METQQRLRGGELPASKLVPPSSNPLTAASLVSDHRTEPKQFGPLEPLCPCKSLLPLNGSLPLILFQLEQDKRDLVFTEVDRVSSAC